MSLLAPAVLAALVVTQAVGGHREIVADARLVGLGAGAIAVALRAPILAVVVVAAAAAAVARLLLLTGSRLESAHIRHRHARLDPVASPAGERG